MVAEKLRATGLEWKGDRYAKTPAAAAPRAFGILR